MCKECYHYIVYPTKTDKLKMPGSLGNRYILGHSTSTVAGPQSTQAVRILLAFLKVSLGLD